MGVTFSSGGVMMWPLLLIGLGVIGVTIRTAVASRGSAALETVERGREAILFWGVMGAALGFLGTLVGLIQTASVIGRMGDRLSSGMAWDGLAVSLVTLIFGLMILIAALLGWYGLGSVARGPRLLAATEGATGRQ